MMKTAGWKPRGGGEIAIPDPDEARERFDRTLLAPLNIERQRAAVLKMVAQR